MRIPARWLEALRFTLARDASRRNAPSKAREAWLRASGQWTASAKYDAQYARGKWDYLSRIDEAARYSVLAGYALLLKPGGSLLDIGCGEGLLRARLHPAAYRQYIGIDFAEAVERAKHLVDERTTFVVGDMEDYVPPSNLDVIVFNEVLPYFKNAIAGMERYRQFLAPEGVFLVSTFLSPAMEEFWTALGDRYPVIDEVLIANRGGTTWTVKALSAK
jgi:SAM-dependent methyltransferase